MSRAVLREQYRQAVIGLRFIAIPIGTTNAAIMAFSWMLEQWQSFFIAWAGTSFAFYAFLFYMDEERKALEKTNTVSHRSLAMRMRYELHREQLRAGTRLPSIAEYAQRYHTTRTTVSRALKVLADEGLIDIIRGRGVYSVGPDGDRGLRRDKPRDLIEREIRRAASRAIPGAEVRINTRTLMEKYGVTHVTVRRVQLRLAREGIIQRGLDGSYFRP